MLAAEARPRLAAVRWRTFEVRVEHLWILVAVATPFMVAASGTLTTDSWWVLTMGRLALETGWPLTSAGIAFAPAVLETANQQWLAQIALFLLYPELGEKGLLVVAGLVAGLTFGLLLAAARLGGAGPRSAALGVLLAVVLAGSNLIVRAQLLCYPLFVLTYLLLQARHRHPRLVYLLPAVLALWANLHGSFALGLLLILLHAAGETFDLALARKRLDRLIRTTVARWGLLLAASVLATWLNPLGPRVYVYLRSVTTDPSIRSLVTEWRPASIQEPTGLALVGSIALLFVVARRSRRPFSTTEALLLAAFGYLALEALRSVVWWGLVLGPILARHLGELSLPAWQDRRRPSQEQRGKARPGLNLALALFIVVYGGLAPLWLPSLLKRPAGDGPSASGGGAQADLTRPSEAAMEVLSGLPAGGRLFHFQPWTGYLGWRLWPAQQPMLDGRIEVHPPAVWNDYLAASLGRADWDSILERYQVDYLVLEPSFQDTLVQLAETSGGWTKLYEDQTVVVLGRRPVSS